MSANKFELFFGVVSSLLLVNVENVSIQSLSSTAFSFTVGTLLHVENTFNPSLQTFFNVSLFPVRSELALGTEFVIAELTIPFDAGFRMNISRVLVQVCYAEKHQITIRAGPAQLDVGMIEDHFLSVKSCQVDFEGLPPLYLFLAVGTVTHIIPVFAPFINLARLAMEFFNVC